MTAEDDDGKAAAEPGTASEAIAAAGWGAGKTLRELAIDLFGAARVDAEWHADGWMRARVQRLRRSGLPARRPPAPPLEPGGQARGSGRGLRGDRGRPARPMKGWDGVRAWRFIRASEGYRKAWRRHNPPLGLPEPAPFPVRLQTGVDLAALERGMFAWEDPYAERPIAPFWVRARMSDGMVTPDARPLAALAAEGGAVLAGLRIGDGSLILKIERKGAAAQVRILGGGAFPADGGLLLVREVARIEDVWSGVPAPRRGRVRGTGIASFCWRWRARPRAGRTGRSPRRCGGRSGSVRNIIPVSA